jgi:hypothetical protein
VRGVSGAVPKHEPGVVIYGDASGFAQQTSGMSDYDMVKEHFELYSRESGLQVPKSNPSVRERINLMNTKLRSARGDIGLLIDKKCKELIMDFEQVCYKGDTGRSIRTGIACGPTYRMRWGIWSGRSAGRCRRLESSR